MNKDLRNALRTSVVACRQALEAEVWRQLEGTYGVTPGGQFLAREDFLSYGAEPEAWKRNREEILTSICHIESTGVPRGDAVQQFVREMAFTALNRLVALKLMEDESRGLTMESVGRGKESKGFLLFQKISPEVCRAAKNGDVLDGGYRLYLEFLFDDLATELGVLFDRRLPQSIIFPSDACLKRVLDILNGPDISALWSEDETIGWVYQYFTPKELRDSARAESSAPRNSHELAFRNQFYTPRYVVEFLTDNTLGRLWWEMRRGQTALTERCGYLVRRKRPVFMGPGEREPEPSGPEIEYVAHRPKKDPRDLRVLDPACGSGHFLLYAYDLLTVMYEEAWGDPDSPASQETGNTLRDDYPTLEKLRATIPDLIIRHNLHGIDIDLRATQIAALALWLRAQRSFQELGLKLTERPPIRRSNIVCAEPMPGERDLLDEFVGTLQPRVLGQLVRVVFDRMTLAGEAGSLLKIEAELRDAIAEAKAQWLRRPRPEQMALFAGLARRRPEQVSLFDVSEITDEAFWEVAEARVLEALDKYARGATDGQWIQRRLFGEDAVQGFAFVDLCRRCYDVILMNPPFGKFVTTYRQRAREDYPLSYNDIFGAFVDRFLDRVPSRGFVGAITSRAGFFLSSFANWRTKVVLEKASLRAVADLGPDVMDEAMVEAVAYALERTSPSEVSPFIRLVGMSDRETVLREAILAIRGGNAHPRVFLPGQRQFGLLPDSPFVYWVSERILEKFASLPPLEPIAAEVRVGLQTSDDSRFVRAIWEVPADRFWPATRQGNPLPPGDPLWVPHVKAGTSQPWFSPITVVVNWGNDGLQLRNFLDEHGRPKAVLRNTEYYFRPGFSWTRRAVRLIPYAIPTGCIPTVSRYMAYPQRGREFEVLGVAASNLASAYLRFFGEKFHWPNFLVDNLKALPWVSPPNEVRRALEALASREVERRRQAYRYHEPFHEFAVPDLTGLESSPDALKYDPSSLLGSTLEAAVAEAYGLTEDERLELERDLQEAVAARFAQGEEDDEKDEGEGAVEDEETSDTVLSYDPRTRQEAMLSYAVGVAFGRWDVRLAQDPTLITPLPGPFDPLPLCPPGMLLGSDGLPARPAKIASVEWLRARRSVNILPAEGTVANPSITDEGYPVSIAWDGILVDDPGHADDIVRRVREVLVLLWADRAEAVEKEACETLGVKELRDYFRNPRGFFEDHIKRYSKSRRKAPIYWLLQSARKSYGVWLYYHRLERDTVFKAIRHYVEPKIRGETTRLKELRARLGAAKEAMPRRERTKREKEIDDQDGLITELGLFKQALEQVAALDYDPDLNDGVVLNIAPFHELTPWKEAKAYWAALLAGKYEWSTMSRRLKVPAQSAPSVGRGK